jgi:type II secretory pathway pseudopilin PulG
MDRTAEMIGPEQRGERRPASGVRAGFSLIDLLVSMMVMSVLIAVLLPAVGHVRDMARRTECRSNIRQQGLALQMYAYDHNGRLPQSVFSDQNESGEFAYAPGETVCLRVNAEHPKFDGGSHPANWSHWDGLGILFAQDYLTSPQVFYCPSNQGLFDYPEFASMFAGAPGQIVGNYQYRLIESREYLSDLEPRFTIISNATRSAPEYSHRVGNNMLKADMSVSWFTDIGGRLLATIANPGGAGRGELGPVDFAWRLMDTDGRYSERAGGRGSRLEDSDTANPQGGRVEYKDP